MTINKDNLYGLMDKDGNVIAENSYKYLDYAFGKYFIAYKDEGMGVIDKDNKTQVDFKYDLLSRVGNKNVLKAMKMGKNENSTTIFAENSGSMKMLFALEDAIVNIYDNYVEAHNKNEYKYINENGELKTAKEIFTDNKLFITSKNDKIGFEDRERKY